MVEWIAIAVARELLDGILSRLIIPCVTSGGTSSGCEAGPNKAKWRLNGVYGLAGL